MAGAICAAATTLGGAAALVRLSGSDAQAIARRAGLAIGAPWTIRDQDWSLPLGTSPCRALFAPRGRSATGEDLLEIVLPGSEPLVADAIAALIAAGAEAAGPGAFTRQAWANGRLRLDQAEAILALTAAQDAPSAARALARLTGELGAECAALAAELLALRARVEAGLDFAEEEGVHGIEPAKLASALTAIRVRLARWRRTAAGIASSPRAVIVGAANAGKSSLFTALTGVPALVSAIPGTTRDTLEGELTLDGRRVLLVDTAGWMSGPDDLERAALAHGRQAVVGAALILALSAPDAPLPAEHGLDPARTLIVATKADMEGARADPRAAISVSVRAAGGLDGLRRAIAVRLSYVGDAEPRQQRLLERCDAALAALLAAPPSDELLAEDLRQLALWLGELIGTTTSDEVLVAIFSQFCIGK